jgi:transcriptional regulator with XRE-family HTH domain
MTTTNPLHDWRKSKGMSQAAAGTACGVDRLTWWRWENGKSRIDIELLDRVEGVTGINRALLRPDIFEGAV